MRSLTRFLSVIAGVVFLSLPITLLAKEPPVDVPQSRAQTQPNENDLTSHKSYINSDGATVHSPAKSKAGQVPAGASAQCRDGSYSFSRHRSGTCSHHGGVAQWL